MPSSLDPPARREPTPAAPDASPYEPTQEGDAPEADPEPEIRLPAWMESLVLAIGDADCVALERALNAPGASLNRGFSHQELNAACALVPWLGAAVEQERTDRAPALPPGAPADADALEGATALDVALLVHGGGAPAGARSSRSDLAELGDGAGLVDFIRRRGGVAPVLEPARMAGAEVEVPGFGVGVVMSADPSLRCIVDFEAGPTQMTLERGPNAGHPYSVLRRRSLRRRVARAADVRVDSRGLELLAPREPPAEAKPPLLSGATVLWAAADDDDDALALERLLRAAGTEYHRRAPTEAPDAFKATRRALGELPALSMPDGRVIERTMPILRTVARANYLTGRTPADAARCDQLADALHHWRSLAPKLDVLERLIEGKFAVGASMTYADVLLIHCLERGLDRDEELLMHHPRVWEYHDRLRERLGGDTTREVPQYVEPVVASEEASVSDGLASAEAGEAAGSPSPSPKQRGRRKR